MKFSYLNNLELLRAYEESKDPYVKKKEETKDPEIVSMYMMITNDMFDIC